MGLLAIYLKDNVKARRMNEDGSYAGAADERGRLTRNRGSWSRQKPQRKPDDSRNNSRRFTRKALVMEQARAGLQKYLRVHQTAA